MLGGEGLFLQPLVKPEPVALGFEGEQVWHNRSDGAGLGPAQEPVLAVGEDAHADPSGVFRLLQVSVELGDMVGMGTAMGADALFGFQKGVQGG